jgi:hypothetical protein
MRTMGFEEKWIALVMKCVKSVSYSVLVNGVPYGNILPSRGLRQGDPLSPYLFLIAAEGLSSLLSRAALDNRLTGVSIFVGGYRLSHLFFPDDSLLFCRATAEEWENRSLVLKLYERASGQQLNAAKTSIFFSKNTSPEIKDLICTSVGIPVLASFDKYLGLPAMVGRSKTRTFKSICSRVQKKIDGWKEKFLSQAGKEILIKAIVQAIPTYCMSVFLLPKVLCKSLNTLINKFWWGHKANHNRISWMSWERLGFSKARGGMGFRDLQVSNKALLAKQGWRLITNFGSLVARIFKEKYYPSGAFMEASIVVALLILGGASVKQGMYCIGTRVEGGEWCYH